MHRVCQRKHIWNMSLKLKTLPKWNFVQHQSVLINLHYCIERLIHLLLRHRMNEYFLNCDIVVETWSHDKSLRSVDIHILVLHSAFNHSNFEYFDLTIIFSDFRSILPKSVWTSHCIDFQKFSHFFWIVLSCYAFLLFAWLLSPIRFPVILITKQKWKQTLTMHYRRFENDLLFSQRIIFLFFFSW